MRLPTKTKELTWSKVGNTYILVDPDTQKTYNIDTIAFLVWVQCDGMTDIEEITDVFSVDGNRDIVRAAINGILDKLKESGLIN